jgi:hypothetical protein
MTQIRKIYYDLLTGNILYHISFNSGQFVNTTFDQDYFSILDLKSRAKETIGLLMLENDNNDQNFALCNSVKVNVDTKELVFTYPSDGESTVTPEKPLTTQVTELKTENSQLKQQLMQQNDDLQGFMDFYFSTLA